MRVFVAGASGAIGTTARPAARRAGPRGGRHLPLAGEGRTGCAGSAPSRSCSTCSTRRPCGNAVAAARPDAIVHQATALAGLSDFKHFDRSFAPTNRLRTSGHRRAARGRRAKRVWRASSPRATPAGRTRARAGRSRARTIRSIRRRWRRCARRSPRSGISSRASSSAGGTALRYGGFYGGSRRRPARARAQASLPDRRRRRRGLVVRPPRRRGRGHRPRARARRARDLQRRRRRARAGAGVAARARRGDRREAAAPRPALARAARWPARPASS